MQRVVLFSNAVRLKTADDVCEGRTLGSSSGLRAEIVRSRSRHIANARLRPIMKERNSQHALYIDLNTSRNQLVRQEHRRHSHSIRVRRNTLRAPCNSAQHPARALQTFKSL